MRSVAFPELKSFSDLFDVVPKGTKGVPWTDDDYSFRTGKKKKATIEIGPYCAVSNPYRSLYVKPKEKVIEAIKERVLFTGTGDAITFKVVIRSDNEALVTADNSKIIGGTWLALIDPSTIPEEVEV